MAGAWSALFLMFFQTAWGAPPKPAVSCPTCHQSEGAPRLDGLARTYLSRQITQFIRGERGRSADGGICAVDTLRALRPADLLALINRYAAEVVLPNPATPSDAAAVARGAALYQDQRPESGIQPCAACHGRDGTGGVPRGFDTAVVAPRLAGQREAYVLSQLKSFRHGIRANDVEGVMRRMVADLFDPELAALAAYVSTLDPATVPIEVPVSVGVMPERAAPCLACHGSGGESMVETFPKIGGQLKGQILKQLKDIRDGRRVVDVMTPVVYALSDADMESVADWFSRSTMHRGPHDPIAARRGEELFFRGNISTGGYPACMYCHGMDGKGIAGIDWAPGGIPRIAGQHPGYLRKALEDFRSGRRTNDHAKMMSLVAVRMTDQEIADVVQYLYNLGD